MKIAKKIKRFCPYCKKKTEQKVTNVASGGKRGTLTRGSIKRGKLRGLGVGFGNLGNWGSKPAVSKFKRKTKSNKKTNIKYTCLTCNKSKYQKKGNRVGKVLVEDKK